MMKRKLLYIISVALLACNMVSAQVLPVPAAKQTNPVLLSGATIHVGNGEVIENGALLFDNGVITAIGKAGEVSAPANANVVELQGKHVYPGLILMNSNLGLSEIGSVEETQDSREIGQINPGVRTLVAYNTDSHVIPVVRANGILLAQVAPSGGLLSGTSSVMQLDAWNWEDAAYSTDNGVHISWPRMSSRGGRGRGGAFGGGGGASNFDESLRELDNFFADAAAYAELEKPARRNLHLEAIEGLFTGNQTLYINVSEAKGIISSVEFARKHGVKKIVLVGVGEDAWLVKDFIKEENIPVVLGTIFSMPSYEHSDTRLPFKMAKMFNDEGILTGISWSGSASGFNLPFAAGQTVAYGVSKEDALKMITFNNAKILGIDSRTGSLEKGKDANIVVSTGDMLDMMTNNIELAFINGRSIDLNNKFKMLHDRFDVKYSREDKR